MFDSNPEQQRLGSFAEDTVTRKTHAKEAVLDRLVAIAKPQPDWVVPDIATGGGGTNSKFGVNRWMEQEDSI